MCSGYSRLFFLFSSGNKTLTNSTKHGTTVHAYNLSASELFDVI